MKYYIGIDPSTVSTGYAVLDQEGNLVEHGVIKPDGNLSDHEKVTYQYRELKALVEDYDYGTVAAIGCEDQFNGPNVMTLIKIARTASMAMLVAGEMNIELTMFYPSSWRLLFHGNGKATKRDTLKMVNEMHDLSLKGKDNDIADAIGIAHATLLKCQGGCGQTEKK